MDDPSLQGSDLSPSVPGAKDISHRDLFRVFAKIGLLGFGGVTPWLRRFLVEEEAWLSDREFAELFGFASTLPGANTVSVAVMLGDRNRGLTGAIAALSGLVVMPLMILAAVASLYDRFAALPDVKNAIGGAAAATAGLVIGNACKTTINMKPGELAKTFVLISVIAVGGATATVPEIHRQVVDTLHWMDNATFANILAVSQIAPGPNVMIIGMIGWQVAGPTGLTVSMLAILAPSCTLAFFAGRAMLRYSTLHIVAAARQALAPIAVGLILASGFILARAADRNALTLAITAGMTIFIIRTRANPLFGLLMGAFLGFVGGRIGVFA